MLTIQGMLNIHKYIGYCMDEGYVDRGKYSEEAAETIKAGRTLEMKDDIVRKMLQNAYLAPSTQPALAQQQNPLQSLFAQLANALTNPNNPIAPFFNAMAQLTTPLTQALGRFLSPNPNATPAPSLLGQLVGNLMSFYHGTKKTRDEEAKQRDLDELPHSDLFTRFVVEQTMSGGQSGSSP